MMELKVIDWNVNGAVHKGQRRRAESHPRLLVPATTSDRLPGRSQEFDPRGIEGA